jgi:hypothetical protein
MPIEKPEKQKLLTDIKDSLQHMKYLSVSTGHNRTLMPHHLKAIMKTLEPIINRFFEDHLIQAKSKIWD